MNAISKIQEAPALAGLRAPFPPHQISKLPKPTKAQTDAVKADFKAGIRCTICGTWHHPQVVHLDYVGHAALTDRLLDTDPAWSWEPAALTAEGLPAFDRTSGLWIKLTVNGVTRLGYGAADGKSGGDAVKEIIGDALRNAAMRFGAALDLWHKGDLHVDDEPEVAQPEVVAPKLIDDAQRALLMTLSTSAGVMTPELLKACQIKSLDQLPADKYDFVRQWLSKKLSKDTPPANPQASAILADEIPY